MLKIFFISIGITLLASCSGISIIPTKFDKSGKVVNYSPVPENEIKIYSYTKVKGNEFGVISQEGEAPAVENIYKNFRKIASENGANYVTGFKLKTELQTVMEHYQSCTTSGPNNTTTCHDDSRMVTKQLYKASGSLVRREE